MATLREIAEAAGRVSTDSLHQLELKEKQAQSDLDSAKTRLGVLEKELADGRPLREAIKSQYDAITTEISSLERKLSELRSQLSTLENEQLRKSEEASKLRKERSKAETDLETLQNLLSRIISDKFQAEHNLHTSQRSALRTYLDGVADGLSIFADTQDKNIDKVRALERLRQARDESHSVATLCETREELIRLLSEARVPKVIESLRGQISSIEKQIEIDFPGAIAAESHKQAEELEEIYYLTLPNGHNRIFLPIKSSCWKSIADGETGSSESLAVRLVWALRTYISGDWDNASIRLLEGLNIVILDLQTKSALSESEFTVTLDNGATITLFFSLAPPSVAAAMISHDDNK